MPLLSSLPWRFPMQALGFTEPEFLSLLHIIVDRFLTDKDNMLPLPKLDHIQMLQGRDDIFRLDSSLNGNILDGNVVGWIVFREQVQQDVGPIAAVGNLAQVRERLFG